ncbi:hypothetical protein M5K25_016421 [Dendrobium thyrsiflorum]|uniref:CRIB domain-containing protein n=1 Tax=Dendrobium thyrsiflorum TaxID=117978 RepID=A0ABD0UJJ0_DENTH
MMNNKMKGLLKGLRYISQIFEEEKEMQIGYPTDVKHVAHFGCDGPSANAPSWMGEYQLTPANNGKGLEAPTQEMRELSINPTRSQSAEPHTQSPVRRPHRRRSSAPDSPFGTDSLYGREKDSSNRENRHSRREQSAGSSSAAGDYSAKEPSDGSFRRSRRHYKVSTTGSESPARDSPSVPKQSRRRKSKGETGSAASVVVGIP